MSFPSTRFLPKGRGTESYPPFSSHASRYPKSRQQMTLRVCWRRALCWACMVIIGTSGLVYFSLGNKAYENSRIIMELVHNQSSVHYVNTSELFPFLHQFNASAEISSNILLENDFEEEDTDQASKLGRILWRNAPFFSDIGMSDGRSRPKSWSSTSDPLFHTWERMKRALFTPQESIESLISKFINAQRAYFNTTPAYNPIDYAEMGRRFQAFAVMGSLYDKVVSTRSSSNDPQDYPYHLHPDLRNLTEIVEILDKFYTHLVPWTYRDHIGLTSERGIVMLVGNGQFEWAVHTIKILRQHLNCDLPIEVFSGGPKDLDFNRKVALEHLPGVKVMSLFRFFNSKQLKIGAWAMKPFSLLASSFSEPIFMDADVLFLQNPIVLYNFSGYNRTGTVFFHDRQIRTGYSQGHHWVELFWRENHGKEVYSPDSEQTKFLKIETGHEQDSGVVLVNKKTPAFYALLATCALNKFPERGAVYHHLHGDKETFWLGWELLKVPYFFPLGYGGTIGWPHPRLSNTICGGLYHPDENWNPLWWNGGVLMNKHKRSDLFFPNLTHYATNKHHQPGRWIWETDNYPFCYAPRFPQEEVGELSEQDQALGKDILAMAVKLHVYHTVHDYKSMVYL